MEITVQFHGVSAESFPGETFLRVELGGIVSINQAPGPLVFPRGNTGKPLPCPA